MVRTQIYLPEELHYQLAQMARIEDSSISEIIRQKLYRSIKTNKKKKSPAEFFDMLIKMGKKHRKYTAKLPKDFSARHTEYYLESVFGK